jgi:cytochrome oxidase Cu insertion factor (SCO1/SenC/PrrC family)
MAINRWFKWIAIAAAAMIVLIVALAGAGLWYLSARIAPDVEVGQAMPAITMERFDGEPVSLESLRGRVVVLDFWSSW